jgi:hypothetical protein
MQQALMCSIGSARIAASATGNRFHTFAITVAKNPHSVDRERLASAGQAKYIADLPEVLVEPRRRSSVHSHRHEVVVDHAQIAKSTAFSSEFITDRNDPAFACRRHAPPLTQ